MTTEPKDPRGGDFAQQNGPKASDPPPVREDFGPLARWQAAPAQGKHMGCLATYDDGSPPTYFPAGEAVRLAKSCRVQPVFSGPCVTDYARMRAACAEAERRLGSRATPDPLPVSREAVRKRIADLIRDAESDIYWSCEKGRDFDSSALIDAILALTGETSRE